MYGFTRTIKQNVWLFLFGLHALSLRMSSLIVKMCYTIRYVGNSWKKVNFLKLVKFNSLTLLKKFS